MEKLTVNNTWALIYEKETKYIWNEIVFLLYNTVKNNRKIYFKKIKK